MPSSGFFTRAQPHANFLQNSLTVSLGFIVLNCAMPVIIVTYFFFFRLLMVMVSAIGAALVAAAAGVAAAASPSSVGSVAAAVSDFLLTEKCQW